MLSHIQRRARRADGLIVALGVGVALIGAGNGFRAAPPQQSLVGFDDEECSRLS